MKYVFFQDKNIHAYQDAFRHFYPSRDVKEVYVFENPQIIVHGEDMIGVRPNEGKYGQWIIDNGELEKIDSGKLAGMGVKRQELHQVDATFNKTFLAKILGISLNNLEKILR